MTDSLQTFTDVERAWLHAVACDYIEAWRDICSLSDPADIVDPPVPIVYAITQVDLIPDCWYPPPESRKELRDWMLQEREARRDAYNDHTVAQDLRLMCHESVQVASSIIRKLSVTGV